MIRHGIEQQGPDLEGMAHAWGGLLGREERNCVGLFLLGKPPATPGWGGPHGILKANAAAQGVLGATPVGLFLDFIFCFPPHLSLLSCPSIHSFSLHFLSILFSFLLLDLCSCGTCWLSWPSCSIQLAIG